MRPVCALLLEALCVCAPAMAAPSVTLILQFDQDYSPRSLAAMEQEVAAILAKSSLRLEWRFLADIRQSDVMERLVVVRFRGTCSMTDPRPSNDSRSDYGFTHVSDGRVLPFSEVECDKVRSSIVPEMSSMQWHQSESILGRALGRVLAHEMYHMLTRTRHHDGEGVTRSALSPSELIAGRLTMTRAALEMLKR